MAERVPLDEMKGWHEERSIVDGLPLRVSPDGLTVYSEKRNRFYARKFNHDYARQLRDLGYTYGEIARTFDVVPQAIAVALDHDVAKKVADRSKIHGRTACEGCGGPTLKADHPSRHVHDGRILCNTCRARARRTRIRFYRDGSYELHCKTCSRWLPPEAFGRGQRYPDIRDGGFHSQCRSCTSKARTDYRARHRVPCEGGCGRMVEGRGRSNRVGADPNRPYLCRKCPRPLHA